MRTVFTAAVLFSLVLSLSVPSGHISRKSNDSFVFAQQSGQTCQVDSSGKLPAPTGISTTYDATKKEFTVSWDKINCPTATYDVVAIVAEFCTGSCKFTVNTGLAGGPYTLSQSVFQNWQPVFTKSSQPPIQFCVDARSGDANSVGQPGSCDTNSFVLNQGTQQYSSTFDVGPDDCGCNPNKPATWFGKVWSFVKNPGDTIGGAICQSVCAVSKALGGLVSWLVERLIDVAGVSYRPPFIERLATTCWLELI